jgi:hypothetical protein
MGTFKYKVKSFPKAQLAGTTISKTSGFIANVSLGADSPFTGVTFKVVGGNVDDIPFNGTVVPASVISKVRIGKKVPIEVSYTRNGSGKVEIATGVLKVVN